MKVYPNEKSLSGLISSKTTASYEVKIDIPEDQTKFLERARESFSTLTNKKIKKAIAGLNEFEHPDLMYGSAILVSTVMNKNDDVFLPENTWPAKNTPINTPYNQEHEENDIIGHIIASRTLDKSGNELETDFIPEYFDIEVDFVIYQSIYPEVAKCIAENAPQGKQFVSMECRFSDFDYALFDEKGEATLIERNDATSFLTKYLRAYGGEGVYKDSKIGRVLKNIRFTGMGNVKSPANPASEYTKINKYELASASFLDEKDNKFILIEKGKVMTIENLEKAKEVIDGLNKDLALAKTNVELAKSEAEKNLQAERATLNTKLEAETVKVEAGIKELEKANQTIAELTEKLKTSDEALEAAKKECMSMKKDKAKKERCAKIKALEIDFDEATVQKMVDMEDSAFESLYAALEITKTKLKPTGEDSRASELEKAKAEENANDKILEEKGDEPNAEKEAQKVQEIADKIVACVRKPVAKKGKDSK